VWAFWDGGLGMWFVGWGFRMRMRTDGVGDGEDG